MSEKYVTREGVGVTASLGIHSVGIETEHEVYSLGRAEFDRLFKPASEQSEFVSVRRTLVQAAIDLLKVDRRTTTATLLERALAPKAAECKHDGEVNITASERVGGDGLLGAGMAKVVTCKCGMTRKRGWISDWQQPEASDGH